MKCSACNSTKRLDTDSLECYGELMCAACFRAALHNDHTRLNHDTFHGLCTMCANNYDRAYRSIRELRPAWVRFLENIDCETRDRIDSLLVTHDLDPASVLDLFDAFKDALVNAGEPWE